MTDLSCGRCIHWEKFDNRGYGLCRRHAPQPLVNQQVTYGEKGCESYPAVSWPVTEEFSDWCSEGKESEYFIRNIG